MATATLYRSSKGDREIATMPLSYAKNAMHKLLREEPERTAEIEALRAHVDGLEAADGANPRAVIGGNNPPPDEPAPAPTGRAAVETHVADLLVEAGNWADGVAITSQEQADEVGKLHRMLQQAAGLVDETAAGEKRPLNDALAEIAAWQNGYTAKGLKKTPDGRLTRALAATGNLVAGWLRKLDDERREREAAAAKAARDAAQAAIALREEAKAATDIAVMDRAEDALADARALLRGAESVAKERVRTGAGEGVRAIGLRSVWSAHPTGEAGCWAQAYAHYKTNPEFMAEFHGLIQRWADRDARTEATRVRGVPGFHFVEQKVAA